MRHILVCCHPQQISAVIIFEIADIMYETIDLNDL